MNVDIKIIPLSKSDIDKLGIYEIGKNIATGNFKEAREGVARIGDIGSNFGDKFAESIKKEIEGWENIFKLPGQKEGDKSKDSTSSLAKGGLGKPSGTGKESVSGVEKITAGTRNITININKLVESVNISKTFGRNNESELVEAVKRALLTGVNDVNIVAQ